MSAPRGNDYKQKWKTHEERQKICRYLYDHLCQGLPKEAFPHASWKTVKSYMRKFPEDFPPDYIEEAERTGACFWEKIGLLALQGKLPRFKSKSWCFIMRNKYGWGKKPPECVENNSRIIYYDTKTRQPI